LVGRFGWRLRLGRSRSEFLLLRIESEMEPYINIRSPHSQVLGKEELLHIASRKVLGYNLVALMEKILPASRGIAHAMRGGE